MDTNFIDTKLPVKTTLPKQHIQKSPPQVFLRRFSYTQYITHKLGLHEAIEYEKGHLETNTKTLSNITGEEIMQGAATEVEEALMSELFG